MMPSYLPLETLYVTMAAARAYQEMVRCGEEQARRELTQMLIGARLVEPENGTKPATYRLRSRKSRLELVVQVVREEQLLVVVAAHIRKYNR